MIVISVIIPVKNGAATIQRCLNSIFTQTISAQIEVIIIDSGSTDNSLEIVNYFNIKLHSIDSVSFNHGLTRNLGVNFASGNFIYYTVQDAQLSADDTLERMLCHFDDGNVAAVCGNQGVPHEQDKNPVDWYKPVSDTGTETLYFSSPQLFDGLSPKKKTEVCGWDDVNAMYRKSALVYLPFEKCDFGEDMIWCKAALRHGYTLKRDTGLLTWHYHFRTYQYQFKIRLTVGCLQYKEFDFVPTYPSVISRIKLISSKLLKESSVTLTKKVYWFFHNLSILAADIIAVKLLKKAAANGGAGAMKELYETKGNKQIMGRLKNQKNTI